MTATVLLIHGGLWEPMDAQRFWGAPGITDGLTAAGLTVLAPDRPKHPGSWDVEFDALSELLTNRAEPVTIVGASNGCTVAARLTLAYPDLVDRLVLAWPATAGDAEVDTLTLAGLLGRGCTPGDAARLLAGDTLRGTTDAELAGLARLPVAVLPSLMENPMHQRATVDALLQLVPGSRELSGYPEPPRPDFPPYLDQFVRSIVEFVN
ncbi:alpha/beta fold hydrolase [Kribbella antibiotica]|uniref:Alpha/beta fold hydrolase n=1 Tax=Kribbella antibiotica TaxID=190195 RepID=A0A4V2YQH0_9ACTN|nr:alpha/beta fold hydrolase [Kribbella antibiotica]TDD62017.1 alpha/beta fold hydrolase [Kribbella antibiotica]